MLVNLRGDVVAQRVDRCRDRGDVGGSDRGLDRVQPLRDRRRELGHGADRGGQLLVDVLTHRAQAIIEHACQAGRGRRGPRAELLRQSGGRVRHGPRDVDGVYGTGDAIELG